MGETKAFMKNLMIVISALYFYFAALFFVGFISTWAVIRISISMLPLTDIVIYSTAIIIFSVLVSADLYFVSKKKWSLALILLTIPFIIYKFVQSVVKKTLFTFDLTQTPLEYKELNDSFKNIFKPIQKPIQKQIH